MTGAKATFSLHGFSCNFSIQLCGSRLYQISWHPLQLFMISWNHFKILSHTVFFCCTWSAAVSSPYFSKMFSSRIFFFLSLFQSLNLILSLQDECITLLSLQLESYSHPFSLSDSPIEEGAANIYTLVCTTSKYSDSLPKHADSTVRSLHTTYWIIN